MALRAYAKNRDEWAKQMVVLENKGVMLKKGNRQLLIYGFDNSTYGNERYLWQSSQEADMTVVLAHSPNIISLMRQEGITSDLLLTGHTHGGQIRLWGKAIGGGAYRHFHVGQKPDKTAGLFSISRGLGTTKLPIRLNCFPEITVYQINQGKAIIKKRS